MATPLSDEIRALIAYSNEKTGANDQLLGDAVHRLAEGYGTGSAEPVDDWAYLLRDAERGTGNVKWGPEVFDLPFNDNTVLEIYIDTTRMPEDSRGDLAILSLGGNTSSVQLNNWSNWESLHTLWSPGEMWRQQIKITTFAPANGFSTSITAYMDNPINMRIEGGWLYLNGVKAHPLSSYFLDQIITSQQLQIGQLQSDQMTAVYIKYIRYKQV